MMLIFVISILISLTMIMINSSISIKSFNDREKPSSFECGFNPLYFSRSPFSMQFFLIAVIFLIFDIEITIIMPFPLIIQTNSLFSMISLISYFIFILTVGLFYEWLNGALFWPK